MSAQEASLAVKSGAIILYRDGQAYNVARVDLVRERHVTAFPFDRSKRRYQKGRKRVAVDQVVGELPAGTYPAVVSAKLNALMNQHMAMRRKANSWLEEQACQLAGGQV